MSAAVLLLLLLALWTDEASPDAAPALPSRARLHGSAELALTLYPAVTKKQVEKHFDARQAAYRGVQVAEFPEAKHALWAAHLLAELDRELMALREAHALRTRLGRPVSATGRDRLTALRQVNEALAALGAELDARLPPAVRAQLTALADSLAEPSPLTRSA